MFQSILVDCYLLVIILFVCLLSLGGAPVFCLTPTRTEKDFLFHLGEKEGLTELYDVNPPAITSLTSPSS